MRPRQSGSGDSGGSWRKSFAFFSGAQNTQCPPPGKSAAGALPGARPLGPNNVSFAGPKCRRTPVMSFPILGLILLSISLSAVAQVLIKFGMSSEPVKQALATASPIQAVITVFLSAGV